MTDIPPIKNFEELLQPVIGNTDILTYKSRYLTATGENYGSMLLAIELTTQNGQNYNFVAKLCPQNEWLKRMFASHVTFKKEIGFYKDIVPKLIQFQKDNNVLEENLLNFPVCLNARINLNPDSNEVDEDAILLLENLKIAGYKTLNRLIGMNKNETQIVLKDLARFHAVPLAYKLQKPEEFQKFMPLLNKICIGEEMFDTAQDKFNESLYRHLNLTEKQMKQFVKTMSLGYDFQKYFPSGSEKYATIVHRDFWTNNTMVLFENNEPIKNKMLDFQVNTYGHPITDLIFFLYTSVELETLKKYYDYFLKLYHQYFTECLQELHCDISEYTFEDFLKECDYYGPLEVSHILVMFRAVFKEPTEQKKMEDMSMDDMFTDEGITDIYKNRLRYTVKSFFEKNWFQT